MIFVRYARILVLVALGTALLVAIPPGGVSEAVDHLSRPPQHQRRHRLGGRRPAGDDRRRRQLGRRVDSNDTLGGTIGTDYDILVSRSTNNGATWTAPAALNTNAATDSGATHPQVTTDGTGNWVAVWQSTDTLGGTIGTDGDILVSRSTNNGATWTAPAALNTNAATDSGDDVTRR